MRPGPTNPPVASGHTDANPGPRARVSKVHLGKVVKNLPLDSGQSGKRESSTKAINFLGVDLSSIAHSSRCCRRFCCCRRTTYAKFSVANQRENLQHSNSNGAMIRNGRDPLTGLGLLYRKLMRPGSVWVDPSKREGGTSESCFTFNYTRCERESLP